MKAKELVGAMLIGVSAIVVGCVITTEKPADSSPPPTPPPPAPVTAVADAAPAPAPVATPAPAPTPEPPADAAAPVPTASAMPDASTTVPAVPPKKPGIKSRKAAGDAGTASVDGGG